jgi:hypothetical protein
MNLKEFERKCSWSKQGIVLVFGWKNFGRQQKTKVRIAAVPAEIRTKHHYLYTDVLSYKTYVK